MSGVSFLLGKSYVKFDWRRPQIFDNRLSASFCALLIKILFVINRYILSDTFLIGSSPKKYNEVPKSSISSSLLLLLIIGTITIFCKNSLC